MIFDIFSVRCPLKTYCVVNARNYYTLLFYTLLSHWVDQLPRIILRVTLVTKILTNNTLPKSLRTFKIYKYTLNRLFVQYIFPIMVQAN